jgi:hypothetical protein
MGLQINLGFCPFCVVVLMDHAMVTIVHVEVMSKKTEYKRTQLDRFLTKQVLCKAYFGSKAFQTI